MIDIAVIENGGSATALEQSSRKHQICLLQK